MKKQSESLMFARFFGALFALVFVVSSIGFIGKSVFVEPNEENHTPNTNTNTPEPNAAPKSALTLTSYEPNPPAPATIENYGFYEQLKHDGAQALNVRDFTKEYEQRVRERQAQIKRANAGKTTTAQSALSGDWWVQISSGDNEDGANRERDKWIEQGYPAMVRKKGKQFTVILGGYSKEEAQTIHKKFKGSMLLDLSKGESP
ncbi:MAG: SPOR domain-containing protein [Cardiobacteriaceae bacterium]|nr:SPOR domain-containing protein [Cardiobacteriaceae bacterium]